MMVFCREIFLFRTFSLDVVRKSCIVDKASPGLEIWRGSHLGYGSLSGPRQ